MLRNLILLAAVLIVVAAAVPAAHAGSAFGHGFAWMNDHDGDGIPNGQDEDWIRPMDGTGYKYRHGAAAPFAHRNGTNPLGSTFRYGNRNQGGNGTPSGTCPLKIRLRLRDGSCI